MTVVYSLYPVRRTAYIFWSNCLKSADEHTSSCSSVRHLEMAPSSPMYHRWMRRCNASAASPHAIDVHLLKGICHDRNAENVCFAARKCDNMPCQAACERGWQANATARENVWTSLLDVNNRHTRLQLLICEGTRSRACTAVYTRYN